MHAEQGKRAHELESKIAIAGRVDAVGCGAVKAELIAGEIAIQSQRRSGNSARTERALIGALAAILEPRGVARLAGLLPAPSDPFSKRSSSRAACSKLGICCFWR